MADFIKKRPLIYSLIRNGVKSQVLFGLVLLDIALAIILVGLSNKPVRADTQMLVQACSANPDWRNCYGKELAKITKDHDFKYVLDVITALQVVDPQTRDCHILAHFASGAETAKNPDKWQQVVKSVDVNLCSYGFVHGIIEGRSRNDPKFTLDEGSITQICEIITGSKTNEGVDQTCAHIMGHVLLAEKDGIISDAVSTCNKLPENLQYQCFSGTFMESFTRDNLVAHEISQRIPWDAETIKAQEELCSSYEGLAAKGCWLEISHMYNVFFDNDPDKVFTACSRAPSIQFRDDCYLHAISGFMKEGPEDEAYYGLICNRYSADSRHFRSCISGIVFSLLNASVLFTDRALKYCATVTDDFKSFCYQTIGRILSTRAKEPERKNLCKDAPEEYRSMCYRGVIINPTLL